MLMAQDCMNLFSFLCKASTMSVNDSMAIRLALNVSPIWLPAMPSVHKSCASFSRFLVLLESWVLTGCVELLVQMVSFEALLDALQPDPPGNECQCQCSDGVQQCSTHCTTAALEPKLSYDSTQFNVFCIYSSALLMLPFLGGKDLNQMKIVVVRDRTRTVIIIRMPELWL